MQSPPPPSDSPANHPQKRTKIHIPPDVPGQSIPYEDMPSGSLQLANMSFSEDQLLASTSPQSDLISLHSAAVEINPMALASPEQAVAEEYMSDVPRTPRVAIERVSETPDPNPQPNPLLSESMVQPTAISIEEQLSNDGSTVETAPGLLPVGPAIVPAPQVVPTHIPAQLTPTVVDLRNKEPIDEGKTTENRHTLDPMVLDLSKGQAIAVKRMSESEVPPTLQGNTEDAFESPDTAIAMDLHAEQQPNAKGRTVKSSDTLNPMLADLHEKQTTAVEHISETPRPTQTGFSPTSQTTTSAINPAASASQHSLINSKSSVSQQDKEDKERTIPDSRTQAVNQANISLDTLDRKRRHSPVRVDGPPPKRQKLVAVNGPTPKRQKPSAVPAKKRLSQFLSEARKKMPVRVRFRLLPPERQPTITGNIQLVPDTTEDADMQDQFGGMGQQGQDGDWEDVKENGVQETRTDRFSGIGEGALRAQDEDWEDERAHGGDEQEGVEVEEEGDGALRAQDEDWEDEQAHGGDEQGVEVEEEGDDEIVDPHDGEKEEVNQNQDEEDEGAHGDDEQEQMEVEEEGGDEIGDAHDDEIEGVNQDSDVLGNYAKLSSVPNLLRSETYKTLKKYPVRPD